jgi:regulator of sirC expression with transglutaminase-like and TPR domain
MGKKNRKKSKEISTPQSPFTQKVNIGMQGRGFIWILIVTAITAICFFPMLKNNFTNWDDEFYVINNALLRGPDWQGIFSQPVVSNYHPLTIISLAVNYAISGLDPSSYLIFNLFLHLLNISLVFYFIWMISDKNMWVAGFTALIFGIHPMHVESVAWVSERKDVLYTLFFFLSLIQYWRFLQTGKSSSFWFCFLLFILSLLSKPAAIILPLVLLLLDYWKGRTITLKVISEKIPFFFFALFFAIVTIKIQSHEAIAGLDLYPLWSRPLFASYVIMIYFLRFFVPYPLSAFHPYPQPEHLGWSVFISPFFIIALFVFIWYQRKNKLVIFGILFFIINLLLVLQIISIGTTIISERYTYVPYTGLAFLFSMVLNKNNNVTLKPVKWLILAVIMVAFGVITFQRTQVWNNSGSLWDDVIEHYPNAPQPRCSRANYTLRLPTANQSEKDANFEQALNDCNIAIKANPNHAPAYENREFIFYNLARYNEAISDATTLIKLDPENPLGYAIRGASYVYLNEPGKALTDLNKSLSINPDNVFALENRALLFYNSFKRYTEAITDFTNAININPQQGSYYLNRSYCYYRLGDFVKAKSDAQLALQKGIVLPENYKGSLQLE